MWLVDTSTLRLQHCDPPSRDVALGTYLHDAYSSGSANANYRYAILSHRWETEEVTFTDMQSSSRVKAGWRKIAKACEQARKDGIGYIWIDTCCINKDSETELSESIKSMYAYYQQAQVCYVYLHDYLEGTLQSDWFTRGWTLQELVAPKTMIFFNKNWDNFGNKFSLRQDLSRITRVDESLLQGLRSVDAYSVAQRLSWAASRRTTRAEDRAYSLLGIFDVDISTNYGEGGLRAFSRLQQAIVAASDDATIYAWRRECEPSNHGMLALAPDAFADAASLRQISVRRTATPASFSNLGLQITLKLIPYCADTYIAVLDCADNDQDATFEYSRGTGRIGIFLRRLIGDDTFVRTSVDGRNFITPDEARDRTDAKNVRLFVKQNLLSRSEQLLLTETYAVGFCLPGISDMWRKANDYQVITGRDTTWDEATRTVTRKKGAYQYDAVVTLDLSKHKLGIRRIRLFFDWDYSPVLLMAESSAIPRTKPYFSRLGAAWTEKELDSFKSFEERTIHDKYGWNEVVYSNGHGSYGARRGTFREGLWMLRGDRLDGLDVHLSTPSDRGVYSVKLKRQPVSIDGKKVLYWHLEIWAG